MKIKTYIDLKIKLLRQFHIELTPAEYLHMISLKREIDVDNYAHDLIMKYVGKE